MKQIITIILIILAAQYLLAQNSQILGKVLKNPSSPVSDVIVTLVHNTDQPFAAGISDNKGIFRFENIPAGNYMKNNAENCQ